jgi:tartrate dehydratase beta subunit/fumarate hydratase class I family protein
VRADLNERATDCESIAELVVDRLGAKSRHRAATKEPKSETAERRSRDPSDVYYAALGFCTALAAVRITSITRLGWESMGTWLLSTLVGCGAHALR